MANQQQKRRGQRRSCSATMILRMYEESEEKKQESSSRSSGRQSLRGDRLKELWGGQQGIVQLAEAAVRGDTKNNTTGNQKSRQRSKSFSNPNQLLQLNQRNATGNERRGRQRRRSLILEDLRSKAIVPPPEKDDTIVKEPEEEKDDAETDIQKNACRRRSFNLQLNEMTNGGRTRQRRQSLIIDDLRPTPVVPPHEKDPITNEEPDDDNDLSEITDLDDVWMGVYNIHEDYAHPPAADLVPLIVTARVVLPATRQDKAARCLQRFFQHATRVLKVHRQELQFWEAEKKAVLVRQVQELLEVERQKDLQKRLIQIEVHFLEHPPIEDTPGLDWESYKDFVEDQMHLICEEKEDMDGIRESVHLFKGLNLRLERFGKMEQQRQDSIQAKVNVLSEEQGKWTKALKDAQFEVKWLQAQVESEQQKARVDKQKSQLFRKNIVELPARAQAQMEMWRQIAQSCQVEADKVLEVDNKPKKPQADTSSALSISNHTTGSSMLRRSKTTSALSTSNHTTGHSTGRSKNRSPNGSGGGRNRRRKSEANLRRQLEALDSLGNADNLAVSGHNKSTTSRRSNKSRNSKSSRGDKARVQRAKRRQQSAPDLSAVLEDEDQKDQENSSNSSNSNGHYSWETHLRRVHSDPSSMYSRTRRETGDAPVANGGRRRSVPKSLRTSAPTQQASLLRTKTASVGRSDQAETKTRRRSAPRIPTAVRDIS